MEISIVLLERTDDLASVLDKIAWAKTNRIAIVLPDRGSPIESQVHLVRVVRKAESLGATVALVTQQNRLSDWGGALGTPVFDDLDKALTEYWRSPRKKNARHSAGKPKHERAVARKNVNSAKTVQSRLLGRWVFFITSLLALGVVVLLFLPSAEIVLSPRAIEQSLVIDVQAKPDLGAPTISGGLPVEEFRVNMEGQAEGRSSGLTAIPENRASGFVVFQNISDQKVEVPKGTVLVSSVVPNSRYVTTETILLPPSDSEEYRVDVEAVSPGVAGNIDAGMINAIEGQIGLVAVVRNPEAVTGGSDSQAPAPSEEDYDRLRQTLIADLIEEAIADVNGRIDNDQTLIKNLVISQNLVAKRYPEVNEPAEELRLVLSTEIVMYAFRSEDIESIAQMALDANLPMGYEPSNEPINITMLSEPSIIDENASWQIFSRRTIWQTHEMNNVADNITGRTIRDASRIISSEIELEKEPMIGVYPAWWSRLPFFSQRIRWILE